MSALSRFAHESFGPALAPRSARARPAETAQPAPLQAEQLAAAGYEVHWADCEEDVREAQRLRFRVFAHEMGAHLGADGAGRRASAGRAASTAGDERDVDPFDSHCEHVLVRLPRRAGESRGKVVGTYRLLAPQAAHRAGGLYCATEFDLRPLQVLQPRMAELGRACVHPDCRSGGVILALWGAVVRYTLTHDIETLLGSVSVPVRGGTRRSTEGGSVSPPTSAFTSGADADSGVEPAPSVRALWQWLSTHHLADPQWQVKPIRAFPLAGNPDAAQPEGGDRIATDAVSVPLRADMPSLIKGYLACNARVLGPPAFDEDFGTADFPMLLRMQDLPQRHRRRFSGADANLATDPG